MFYVIYTYIFNCYIKKIRLNKKRQMYDLTISLPLSNNEKY